MPRARLSAHALSDLRDLVAAQAARGALVRTTPAAHTHLDPKPPRPVTVKPTPFAVVEFGLEVCHGPFPTQEAAEDFASGSGLVQFLVCPLLPA